VRGLLYGEDDAATTQAPPASIPWVVGAEECCPRVQIPRVFNAEDSMVAGEDRVGVCEVVVIVNVRVVVERRSPTTQRLCCRTSDANGPPFGQHLEASIRAVVGPNRSRMLTDARHDFV
jgi:hypothetical protein